MTQVNWLTKEEQKVVNIIVKPLLKKFGFALAHIGDELTSTDIEGAVKERSKGLGSDDDILRR